MKKMVMFATFIAAMATFTVANAQDTKTKKSNKTEQCEKDCKKKEACCKSDSCKNEACAKAKCKDCKCEKKKCKKDKKSKKSYDGTTAATQQAK